LERQEVERYAIYWDTREEVILGKEAYPNDFYDLYVQGNLPEDQRLDRRKGFWSIHAKRENFCSKEELIEIAKRLADRPPLLSLVQK